MNLDYLGDAPDHWKGSIHRVLLAANALHDLHALPMATDAAQWQSTHYDTYARLLCLPTSRVFQQDMTGGVAAHLQAANQWLLGKGAGKADVFLDPNKGLRVDRGVKMTYYVRVKQLGILLPADSGRVLMIYDETKDRGHEKGVHITTLGAALAGAKLHWSAYEAGRQLTMFFVTRQAPRQIQIQNALAAFLGPCAAGQNVPQVRKRLFP